MKEETLARKIAAWCVAHARFVLALSLLCAAASVVLAKAKLDLRTSNLDLIDPRLPEIRRFMDFAGEFGTPNVLVVVLEGEDPRAVSRAAREIGPVLRTVDGVQHVMDRLPLDRETLAALGLDEFVQSDDGTLCCIFVQPADAHSSAKSIEAFVRGVRTALDSSTLAKMGVRAGLTGMPAYALDDRDVIQRDISKLSTLSFVLIFAQFWLAFGAFHRPALAMTALILAVTCTVGFIAIYPGHLTLLSAFFASILFGLGIDYGIHVVNRVEEIMSTGRAELDAIPDAVESIARSLITGALTTAAVFFVMPFSGFRGFAELGIIAGAGVLLCLLATFTVLPALLALFHNKRAECVPARAPRLGTLLIRCQSRPLAIALGAAALVGAFVPAPAFDTDYLNLEPRHSDAVRLEREMVNRTDFSPQFAVFVADSKDRAREISDRLLDEDCVGEVRSIVDLDDLVEETGQGFPGLPDGYRSALESPAGHFAIYAYPQGDTWSPAAQTDFIKRMRDIDPGVTGMPFLGQFMVEQSQRGMRRAAVAGALLMMACVFLDFKHPFPALLAMLPTLLTLTSMHGLMRLLHISYNPINVMSLPIIIGISVDYGVHIVHRFRDESGDAAKAIAGTGRGILLSAGTTLAGFGTLIFTAHRGLSSFALVMTLGLAAAAVISVLVLPAVLKAAGNRNGLRRPESV